MKIQKKYIYQNLFFFFLFILCVILIIAFLRKDHLQRPNKNYQIKNDGAHVIKNIINLHEVDNLKQICDKGDYKTVKKRLIENPPLKKWINENLGEEYMFQDYVWIIKKSSVHTCHRDNNGDFFNEKQKHPSYTLIVYLEDMDKCLGIIPGSHMVKGSYGVNITQDPLVNLLCKRGDAILFDANLIHVGTIHTDNNHLRIQMKVSHREDIEVLNYYQNFNKIVNEENIIPTTVLNVQRNLSCMFPFVSDLSQGENIRTARGSSDGADIGFFQKMFSYLFYGSATFYDLPDAF